LGNRGTERRRSFGVTNLRLKYPGDGPLVFKGLSLTIRPGEKTLLLGPSGCGKSTLLQALCGIVPDTVELPMKADERVVPERWGYVFQDPDAQFCMPYVDEELAFVFENEEIPRSEMPERIRRCLDLVGLSLPEIHTPIDRLSQGMKQRLAIATALALEPDVLFLDEPTALLDPEGTAQVWETLTRVAAEKTVVIVEHKIEGILDWVDRVVVLTPDGALLADGTPADVFEGFRQALVDYGIWHPGVWNCVPPPERDGAAASDAEEPVLILDGFRGLRGGKTAIAVDREAVRPGEWIMVVGENGAGKSSLLLSVMRLLRAEGRCVAFGAEARKTELVARNVGFVFQNPEFQFVADSVEEELLFALDAPDEREAERLLAAYDLLPLRGRHPYQLSMGQKRRLSVAAALAKGQQLLLLDEPTFGLDAKNAFHLLGMLEELRRRGTAVVMVTHDPEIVRRYGTRVWRVAEGRIADSEAVVWN